jgi:hypothetical protein
MKEIKFSGLPRTIQDAVSVTRRLGIRFLWVDALCIIQDSINGEDWTNESSKMADVYGNANLTIAAEAAKDCKITQGFLARSPSLLTPHEIAYYLPNGTKCGSVKACPVEAPETSYLAKKAWTFQEKMLSQRILLFHSRSTSFACHG